VDIRTFGALINRVLPLQVKLNGVAHNVAADNYMFESENTDVSGIPGQLLIQSGFSFKQQFYGTGEGDELAIIGDFGSRIFYFENSNRTISHQ